MFAPKSILSAVAAIAITGGLVAASSAAQARDVRPEIFVPNGRTVKVGYADLNLASSQGQQELNRRITVAASQVCDSKELSSYVACKRITIANARKPVAYVVAMAERGEAPARTQIQVGN